VLYQGVMIARASGRLDGSVWAHNRGGPYVRELGNPNPNPATDEQLACRTAYAETIAAWQALTPSQREAWRVFSQDNPTVGRSGVLRPSGALPEYTRATVIRRQCNIWQGAGLDVHDEPPPGRLAWPEGFPTYTLGDGSDTMIELWPDPTGFALDDQNVMLVWQSPPQLPSVNFYRSPMTMLYPRTSSPAGDGLTVSLVDSAHAGERYFFRFRLSYDNGQLSPDRWLTIDVT
jgi:hypothetical protein